MASMINNIVIYYHRHSTNIKRTPWELSFSVLNSDTPNSRVQTKFSNFSVLNVSTN